MATQEQIQYEVCPACGEFVTYLFPATGWCFHCTIPRLLAEELNGHKVCERCGNPVDGQYRKKCRSCRDIDWLLAHADELDRCIANGLSVWKARQILRKHYKEENKQKCLSCDGPMNRAVKGVSYFCKKPQCRSAQNRLKKLIYEKGFDRTTALQTVLAELKAKRKTANA